MQAHAKYNRGIAFSQIYFYLFSKNGRILCISCHIFIGNFTYAFIEDLYKKLLWFV